MKTLINSFVSEIQDKVSYRYTLEEVYQDYAVLRVIKWESGEPTKQLIVRSLQEFTNPYVFQFFQSFQEMQEYYNLLLQSNDSEEIIEQQSDRVLH